MSGDPTVDLIAETLEQHRTVGTVWRSGELPDGLGLGCRCGWTGPKRAGETARHQAEQVAEALRHGAPEAAGEVSR